MTGTVEFIQRIRYVEVPDEKGEMHVYAVPETVENMRELVRCKDCRWWHESEIEEGFGDCGQANGITLKPSNWFCADGKSKE